MKLTIKIFAIFLLIISICVDAYPVRIFEHALNEPKIQKNDTVLENYSSDLVCSQFNNALQYLHKNKIFSKRFKMDYKVRSGWGYDRLTTEYLSYKLNISESDVWNTDRGRLKEAMKYLKDNISYEDTLMFINNCYINYKTKKNSKWKVLISKTDTESLLIQFSYRKKPNLHGFGLIFLFFYNENNEVVKYYKTTWIE